ncbi:MAG: VWA domain-containing protein [Candidatus Aminicenantes bacterium]|nr:VWA domain-containing protein [Candidatus Aminicenantes bacterium]
MSGAGRFRVRAAAALAALILAGLLPGLRAEAQDQAVRLPKPIRHDVNVTLKLIQVFVTDRQGRPVPGLTREDFSLSDAGQPVAITEFERHVSSLSSALPSTATPMTSTATKPTSSLSSASLPAATPMTTTAAKAGAGPPEKPAAGETKPRLPRKFLLFFDFANNNQRGVRMTQEAALHLLDERIAPGDEIGLISFSLTRGLVVHEFLTTDHAKVRRAVVDVGVKGISGRGDDIEQEYWRQATEGTIKIVPKGELQEVQSEGVKEQPLYHWRRQETKSQAEHFIEEMTGLARGLRYVPGQKNLILFSSGIAYTLIYGQQAGTPQGNTAGKESMYDAGDHVLRTLHEAMLKELGSASVSVFAFDIREAAMVPSLFAYDEETFITRFRDLFTEYGVHQNNDLIIRNDTLTGMPSLRRMSTATGGRFYGNIDEFKRNLADLEALTGTYYVLGYPISQVWDGAYHPLKVEVRGKGLEVRTQAGYFNPKPFHDLSDLEKRLHLLDLAMSDAPLFQAPLPAASAVLAGPAGTPNNAVLLTRLPAESTERLTGAKAEIVTLVYDERDDLVDLRRSEEATARLKAGAVIFASRMTLARGAYKCRVIIRDLDTGVAAVSTARVFVPAPAAGGLRLHTPLLLGPGARAVYLEGKISGRKEEAGATGWTALYPFDASAQEPLLGALPAGTPVLRVLLPLTVDRLSSSRVALRTVLLDSATGRRQSLSVRASTATTLGETIVQAVEISTAGLPTGRYTLYFYAEDIGSGALGNVSASFVIR